MNKKISTTKNKAIYLSLAVVLSISAIAIPIQIAVAQITNQENFLVRLVGAVGQTGLVNISVNNVPVAVNVPITGNVVSIPITANVPVNAVVQICATVLSSGDIVCRTLNTAQQQNQQTVTIPIASPPQH